MDPRCPTDGVRLLLEANPSVELRPTGASMLPAIFPGDHVTLRQPGRLRIGDVVLTDGVRPCLHRVVELGPGRDTLVTCGDASPADDPEVKLDQVVGVVGRVTPHWPSRLRLIAARLLQGLTGTRAAW